MHSLKNALVVAPFALAIAACGANPFVGTWNATGISGPSDSTLDISVELKDSTFTGTITAKLGGTDVGSGSFEGTYTTTGTTAKTAVSKMAFTMAGTALTFAEKDDKGVASLCAPMSATSEMCIPKAGTATIAAEKLTMVFGGSLPTVEFTKATTTK